MYSNILIDEGLETFKESLKKDQIKERRFYQHFSDRPIECGTQK